VIDPPEDIKHSVLPADSPALLAAAAHNTSIIKRLS